MKGSNYLVLVVNFVLVLRCLCFNNQHFSRKCSAGKRERGEMSSISSDQGEVIGQMRGGLVFVKTNDRPMIVKFYQDKIDMKVWLNQPDITILSHGNMLIGFHQQSSADDVPSTPGIMYTFVYPSRSEVDAMYARFRDTTADGPPRENTKYRIYQFFATDPEGRKLEFQAFLHPLETVTSSVR